jgi:hypothetical protein
MKRACVNGHLSVLKLLLEDGRINPRENNREALTIARKRGHVTLVNELRKHQSLNYFYQSKCRSTSQR